MNSCRGMVEEECPIVKWLSWITQAAKRQKKSLKFFVQKIKVFLMQVFIYDQHLPIQRNFFITLKPITSHRLKRCTIVNPTAS